MGKTPNSTPLRIAAGFAPALVLIAIPVLATALGQVFNPDSDTFGQPFLTLTLLATPIYLTLWSVYMVSTQKPPKSMGNRVGSVILFTLGMCIANLFVAIGGCVVVAVFTMS